MLKRKMYGSLAVAALVGSAATVPAHSAETYKIDPAHAFVVYKVNHNGWSNNMGRFNKVSGSFVLDEKNPGASKVSVTIDAASVDSNHAARNKHLRSADFFNAKEFPTIKFVSTKISKTGDKAGQITGNLTLLGVTKSVTMAFKWNGRSKHFRTKKVHTGFSAQVTINRADWGMKKFPARAIGHKITLMIEIEGILQ
jgi:polyisoprenoid-binding protein YceI